LLFVIYRGPGGTVGDLRDVDSKALSGCSFAKPRRTFVSGRTMDSDRSRAFRNTVGQENFATIEQGRRETLDEATEVDPYCGGLIDS
jgi:hypothetical protein